ncbi:MAG: hypothetical protein AAF383_25080 [Cyanobacteria bacterium P01_A01_bin.83]
MSTPSKPSRLLPRSDDDRIFSHFTNAEGIQGIAGIDAVNLKINQQIFVEELKFGLGVNSFLSSAPGQIFVTELGIDASEGQLMNIGVFGNKQNFVIQFSEQEAFLNNGVRVTGQVPSRSIYTIPGGITLKGEFLVTRIRA